MTLTWIKCQGNAWCRLNNVNLQHQHFDGVNGVFVIWHGGGTPWTVLIGHGEIRSELASCRTNKQVQSFLNLDLFVTWSIVPADQQIAVVGSLANKLKPKIPPPQTTFDEVQVNLPW